jgi:hypothetical protein
VTEQETQKSAHQSLMQCCQVVPLEASNFQGSCMPRIGVITHLAESTRDSPRPECALHFLLYVSCYKF